jgi:general secretion pathway protein G
MVMNTVTTQSLKNQRGFTLIELLVVMAIIALLLTISIPKYFHSLDKSREAVLKQDLYIMRDAIDKFFADRGRYPDSLAELAETKYLRKIPPDPMTDTIESWIVIPPHDGNSRGVYDVKSGAEGAGLSGTEYANW